MIFNYLLNWEHSSILPSGINILALTATASKPTLDAVVHHLAMVDPVIIGISPNRPNIFLFFKPCLQLKEFSQQIVELYTMRNLAPKSNIIYCQSFIDCMLSVIWTNIQRLYYIPRHTIPFQIIWSYITNKSDCRRKLLFSSFLFYETVSYSVICSYFDVCKCLFKV